MRGPRKFCKRRSNLDKLFFFFLGGGGEGEDPGIQKHLNRAFRWWADDGATLNAGLLAL